MVGTFSRAQLATLVEPYVDSLIQLRRDIHRQPELAFREHRTTETVTARLREAGLVPQQIPGCTGLICDIGPSTLGPDRGLIAIRADLDALPIPDQKDVPYASVVPGVSHSCGHDVHTAISVGVGLVLADVLRLGLLDRAVRLIFQPAEEVAAGAVKLIDLGALEGVHSIFGLHCDPSLEVGTVGIRAGAITSACDTLEVELSPDLTQPIVRTNVIDAWGEMVASIDSATRRFGSANSALRVTWGSVAGQVPSSDPSAQNLICKGTIRCLDEDMWLAAPEFIKRAAEDSGRQHGVVTKISHMRGTPPTVNHKVPTATLKDAVDFALGAESVADTYQSSAGEDFAWYLRHVPGTLGRLGVRSPGSSQAQDLHQSDFDVDERAIAAGVMVLLSAVFLSDLEVDSKDSQEVVQGKALA